MFMNHIFIFYSSTGEYLVYFYFPAIISRSRFKKNGCSRRSSVRGGILCLSPIPWQNCVWVGKWLNLSQRVLTLAKNPSQRHELAFFGAHFLWWNTLFSLETGEGIDPTSTWCAKLCWISKEGLMPSEEWMGLKRGQVGQEEVRKAKMELVCKMKNIFI